MSMTDDFTEAEAHKYAEAESTVYGVPRMRAVLEECSRLARRGLLSWPDVTPRTTVDNLPLPMAHTDFEFVLKRAFRTRDFTDVSPPPSFSQERP